MIATPIRIIAIVCSLLIATSFALFVIQETHGGEEKANQEITGVVKPTTPGPKVKKQPRRFIDHAAHVLTTPFNGIPASDASTWVRHTIPDLLGLVLFGFILPFLARYADGRA